MDFPSEEWVAALDAELRRAPTGSSPIPLVVQYVVGTDDHDEFAYHLRIGPDGDRAGVGIDDEASVTFRLDAAVADQIRRGEISSEEAFLAGSLDLDGDATAIIEAHRASGDA